MIFNDLRSIERRKTIPNGYTQVTCIKRTASQFLDTRLTPAHNYQLYVKFLGASGYDTTHIYAKAGYPAYRALVYRNGSVYWYMNSAGWASAGALDAIMEMTTSGDTATYTKVSTQQTWTIAGTWKDTSYDTTIKCLYTGRGNFYRLTYKDNNDNLIADMYPCLDNNNVPCVYDTIRQLTFYDENGGTFGYDA